MKIKELKTMVSKSSSQTIELGQTLGKLICKKACIALEGELGTGKTTFVQGFAKGLGVSEKYYITSPTFNIINLYPAHSFTLCHLDLYRLGSAEELEDIGFYDLVANDHILIVEWPGILKKIGFKFDIQINFKFNEHYNRVISFQ